MATGSERERWSRCWRRWALLGAYAQDSPHGGWVSSRQTCHRWDRRCVRCLWPSSHLVDWIPTGLRAMRVERRV